MPGATISERFMQKVRKGPSGCWEWVARRDWKGYGSFAWVTAEGVRVTRPAHCVSYELFVGPIPKDERGRPFPLDHLCRNHGCVLPMHLQPVTHRENQMRGMTKLKRGIAKTHCPKGHPYEGENLIIRRNGFRRCRTCHNEARRGRGRSRVA